MVGSASGLVLNDADVLMVAGRYQTRLPTISLGKRGNAADPEVQAGLLCVLDACKEYGVLCATGALPADVGQRIEQGFRIIMAGPTRATPTLDAGRCIVGR